MNTTGTARLIETPDIYGAFPRLSAQQIKTLMQHGDHRHTQPGDVLFREGDKSYDFFVILEGTVAVVDGYGSGDEHPLGLHGPGRFLGELGQLTGQAMFYTAVAREQGRVLAVPVERLRALVSEDSTLGDLILRVFLLRRSILIGVGAGFRIVGSRYSPDTRRLREFAARNRLPHRWIDLEEDEEAEALLRELGVRPDETPVVIWRGEQVLRNPSNRELARRIGLAVPPLHETVSDLVIVGAGPAGLAAAVYAASEGLAAVVLDAVATGGQAGTSARIENYLGFPSGITGSELAERAVIQAKKFGAHIGVPVEATAVERCGGHYAVMLGDGSAAYGRSLVIATGARYRKLDVPQLEDFEGTSVFYAATQVEAQMCGSDPVAIVGGGNSAGQAAVFLAERVERVRLLILGDDLGETMSRYLADRIERSSTVEVLRRAEVREVLGDRRLEGLIVEDNRTGEHREIEARALFVFIGAQPRTHWLDGQLALDDDAFVLTGPDACPSAEGVTLQGLGRRPYPLETGWPGVFAVGDVRSGSTKRVASAVGEGAMAVHLVHEHLGE